MRHFAKILPQPKLQQDDLHIHFLCSSQTQEQQYDKLNN